MNLKTGMNMKAALVGVGLSLLAIVAGAALSSASQPSGLVLFACGLGDQSSCTTVNQDATLASIGHLLAILGLAAGVASLGVVFFHYLTRAAQQQDDIP